MASSHFNPVTYRKLIYRTSSAVKDFISGNNDATNFFYDGTKTYNSKGTEVTAEDFVTLDIPIKYARDIEGNIEFGKFLRLVPNSDLNNAGTDNGHVGALFADPVSIELNGPTNLREGEKDQLVVSQIFQVKQMPPGLNKEK